MKFSKIREFLSSANYVYAGLTQDDIDELTVDHFIAEIDGTKLVGTYSPLENFEEIEFVV
jgi:hypothetical protein